MSNIDDLIKDILAVENKDDLRKMLAAVRQAWACADARECAAFRIGDPVSFTTTFRGCIQGRVDRINRKTIAVKANDDGIVWRVSPSLLVRVRP